MIQRRRVPSTNNTPLTPVTVTGSTAHGWAKVSLADSTSGEGSFPQAPNETDVNSSDWVLNDGLSSADDAFSRVLRDKDSQLVQLRYQKDGEIANLRHKLRTLSSQLETLSKSHSPHEESGVDAVKLRKALEDNSQMSKELIVARQDVSRLSEQLSFAKQELGTLQEREQKRVLKAPSQREHAEEFADDVHADGFPDSSKAKSSTEHRSVVSQEMPEIVENSQVLSTVPRTSSQHQFYEMSRGPRRPRRRRPVSAGDPASSGPVPDVNPADAKEDNESPSQSLLFSRKLSSVEDTDCHQKSCERQTDSCRSQESHDGTEKARERSKRPRSPDRAPKLAIVWGRSESAQREVENDMLRDALFGDDRAEELFRISRISECRDLRDAISRCVSSNCHWSDLLLPLGGLCNSPLVANSSVALNAVCALVEHNESCRQALLQEENFTAVVNCVLDVLTVTSENFEVGRALTALRIVCCIVSELSLAKRSETTNQMRRKLEHECILGWLQQEESEMSSCCEICAEICTELVLNVLDNACAQEDELEGEFLTQAVLCFAGLLPCLTVKDSVKTSALCALDWTSQVAPYLLDEKDGRVLESIFLYIIDTVHRLRMRVEQLRLSRDAFCEMIDECSEWIFDMQEGHHQICAINRNGDDNVVSDGEQAQENDQSDVAGVALALTIARRLVQRGAAGTAMASEISAVTRNVALNTVAFLGWPTSASVAGLSGEETRFPAVHSLRQEANVESDARYLFHALVRTSGRD